MPTESSAQPIYRYAWSWVILTGWLLVSMIWGLWHLFASHWPVSLTMMFGSFVAGATAEGGGAVAFPVFTKALQIPPATARDFALAIQSIGMTCGSLLIIRSGYGFLPEVAWKTAVGSGLGICLGLTGLAPLIPPPYPKILFTLFTFCFGLFLAWDTFIEPRVRDETLAISTSFGWFEGLVIGLLGGLISSVVGSGADVALFVVLSLRFSCDEKIATRTTIPVMALTSQMGFLFQMGSGNLSAGILNMWWCAVPIVAFGAPLGAAFCSWQKREAVVLFLLLLILIELVTTLILIPFDQTAMMISAGFLALSIALLWQLRPISVDNGKNLVSRQA